MNYTDCHEEPIHIPGHIQSYGYLIGLNAKTKTVEFYSENLNEIFKFEDDLFGWKLDSLTDIFYDFIENPVYYQFTAGRKFNRNFTKILINKEEFYFTIYNHQNFIFLEFEKKLSDLASEEVIYKSIENLNQLEDPELIWNELADKISKITDYDRVMVYKFLSDGSGKVIAETKLDHLTSYLNLYYPESDIPRQARELYLQNYKRIFSNVYAAPVSILSKTLNEIDLTHSNVRAMSPIHGQYLKNTGVSSSFSTSIVVDNKLWGLVTCQNIKPKHIDFYSRIQAETFTIIAANSYMSYRSKREVQFLNNFEKKSGLLKKMFLKSDNLKDSLFGNIEEMLKLLDADGISVLFENEVKNFGKTPKDSSIEKIKNWWATHLEKATVYENNELLKTKGEEFGLDKNTAGILIISLAPEIENVVIFCYRREFKEHINWAGNEEKKVEAVQFYEDERLMVSPRTSFEVFSEQVKGKSKNWETSDLNAAHKVREIIIETLVTQFSKIQELNVELKKLNEELESFTYTVSHDLASPLTSVKLNAQLLHRKNNNSANSDPKQTEIAKNIVHEVDRVSQFLKDILNFSRAKYSNLVLEKIETGSIIEELCPVLKMNYGTDNTKIIVGNTPDVLADETLTYQVFQNVIGNAVKYSSLKDEPKVEIDGQIEANFVVYTIKDNGIGINTDDHKNIFKIFQRSENSKALKGNGVGLHIVLRIMERIGGKIEFESEENKGSVFKLYFQKPNL